MPTWALDAWLHEARRGRVEKLRIPLVRKMRQEIVSWIEASAPASTGGASPP